MLCILGGGVGGDSHIKVMGGEYLLGIVIGGLVPLWGLKSKITSVRGMAVPFRGSFQNITQSSPSLLYGAPLPQPG